jgi:hypothetical protein
MNQSSSGAAQAGELAPADAHEPGEAARAGLADAITGAMMLSLVVGTLQGMQLTALELTSGSEHAVACCSPALPHR